MGDTPKEIAQRQAYRAAMDEALGKGDVEAATTYRDKYVAAGGLPMVGKAQPETQAEYKAAIDAATARKNGDNKGVINNTYLFKKLSTARTEAMKDLDKGFFAQGEMQKRRKAEGAGFSDAILGADKYASAALESIPSLLTGDENAPSFQARVAAKSGENQVYKDAAPVSAFVGGAQGVLASLPAAAEGTAAKVGATVTKALAKPSSVIPAAIKGGAKAAPVGVAGGAVAGAEHGYEESVGDPSQTVENIKQEAGKGAVVGGVIATGLGAGLPVVSAVGGNLIDRLSKNGLVKQIAKQTGQSIADVAAKAADLVRRGQKPTIVELMPEGMAAKAGGKAARTNEGRIAAVNAVETRQGERGGELATEITRGKGNQTKASVKADTANREAKVYSDNADAEIDIPVDHPIWRDREFKVAMATADKEGVGRIAADHVARLEAKASAPQRIQTAEQNIAKINEDFNLAMEKHPQAVEKVNDTELKVREAQDRLRRMRDQRTDEDDEAYGLVRERLEQNVATAERAHATAVADAPVKEQVVATRDRALAAEQARLDAATQDRAYDGKPTFKTTVGKVNDVRKALRDSGEAQPGLNENAFKNEERKAAAQAAGALLRERGGAPGNAIADEIERGFKERSRAEGIDMGRKVVSSKGDSEAVDNALLGTPEQRVGVPSGVNMQLADQALDGSQAAVNTANALANDPGLQSGVARTSGMGEAGRLKDVGQKFTAENKSLDTFASGSKADPGEKAEELAARVVGHKAGLGFDIPRLLAQVAVRKEGSEAQLVKMLTDPTKAREAAEIMYKAIGNKAKAKKFIETYVPSLSIDAAGNITQKRPRADTSLAVEDDQEEPELPIKDIKPTGPNGKVGAFDIPDTYLKALAQRESRGNPNAKAPTSSAVGLYQFTESTWLNSLKKFGAEIGAEDIAANIEPNGSVKDPAMRAKILALRTDPAISSVVVQAFTADNVNYLRNKLGRMPTSAETYAAHFAGSFGASKLIDAAAGNNPSAASVLPAAAKANPNIFYVKGDKNKPRTSKEVLASLTVNDGSAAA